MNQQQKRFWAEIDLNAVEFNYKQIKKSLKDGTKICCVIKADAYGHGVEELSEIYEELGADWFAVSNVEEAIQLRKNGRKIPILILGYTPPECAELLAKYGISQSVFSDEYAEKLQKCAGLAGVNVNIHIKIDTGMGRIGFCFKKRNDETEVTDTIAKVCKCKNLIPEGIFTHFASADEGKSGEEYTKFQYDNFTRAVSALENKGVKFKVRHCSNSAGIFDYPDFQFDMVRAGIILYGANPSDEVLNPFELKPVMSLKSVISQLKTVNDGDFISYGRTYRAEGTKIIATVPVGYADGFRRANSKNGTHLIVNGTRAKIVGRVCMDQIMIDVTDIPNVKEGDIVTILGKDGNEEITADEIAGNNDTISYEVFCDVSKRVPRIYIKDNKTVKIVDYII